MKNTARRNIPNNRTSNYQEALARESAYWSSWVQQATEAGVPFFVDFRMASWMHVDRGPKIPQLLSYDPEAEWIMNGWFYQSVLRKLTYAVPGGHVFVPACGGGGLSLELARYGFHILGVDVAPGAVSVCRQYAKSNPYTEGFGSIRYEVADLNYWQFPENAFDAVVVKDGLHHLVEIDHFLDRLACALKPGGLLFACEDVGSTAGSRLAGGLLYLILTTHVSFFSKIRMALERADVRRNRDTPFENVVGPQLVNKIRERFHIQHLEWCEGLAFRPVWAGDLRLRPSIKYRLLRILRDADEYLVQMGLLRGNHVYLVAIAA